MSFDPDWRCGIGLKSDLLRGDYAACGPVFGCLEEDSVPDSVVTEALVTDEVGAQDYLRLKSPHDVCFGHDCPAQE